MTTLKKGDQAPQFSALDQDGKGQTLAIYAGKKIVVLEFLLSSAAYNLIVSDNKKKNTLREESKKIANVDHRLFLNAKFCLVNSNLTEKISRKMSQHT
jgi:hypothetical protein